MVRACPHPADHTAGGGEPATILLSGLMTPNIFLIVLLFKCFIGSSNAAAKGLFEDTVEVVSLDDESFRSIVLDGVDYWVVMF